MTWWSSRTVSLPPAPTGPPWLHHMAEPRQSPKVSFGGWQSPCVGIPCTGKLALPRVGLVLIAFSVAVTILEALEKLQDLPELGPDTFTEAFPELAGDNVPFLDEQSFTMDITDILTWLDTMDGKDTVPELPSSPRLTTLLNKLPDLSEYVAEGSCPTEQVAAAVLGDSEDTVLNVPYLTIYLNKFPDLLKYRADGSCSKEQTVVANLGNSEDTIPDDSNSPTLTTLLNNLSQYMAEGGCPKKQLPAVGLADSNLLSGVATSLLLVPKEKQGRVAAVLPTWLPDSPMKSPLKGCPEGPPENPPKDPLESPLLSPTAAPQCHLPRMAQLVEEALRRQPCVVLTRLLLPPGIVSCWVMPRSGEAGGRQAKRPTSAGTPKMQETSLWDNMPPKKRKKMVVHWVVKHSKTL